MARFSIFDGILLRVGSAVRFMPSFAKHVSVIIHQNRSHERIGAHVAFAALEPDRTASAMEAAA